MSESLNHRNVLEPLMAMAGGAYTFVTCYYQNLNFFMKIYSKTGQQLEKHELELQTTYGTNPNEEFSILTITQKCMPLAPKPFTALSLTVRKQNAYNKHTFTRSP